MSAHRWHRPKTRAAILRGEEPAWLRKHKRRDYVRQVIIATPPWVDVKALRELARRRDVLTRSTGVRHVLDHIVPLTHPLVCGLNVPENIQIIPAGTNARKLNAWCEWHGDLLADMPPPAPMTLSLFSQVVSPAANSPERPTLPAASIAAGFYSSMQSGPADRSGPRGEGEMPTSGALVRHTGTPVGPDCSRLAVA